MLLSPHNTNHDPPHPRTRSVLIATMTKTRRTMQKLRLTFVQMTILDWTTTVTTNIWQLPQENFQLMDTSGIRYPPTLRQNNPRQPLDRSVLFWCWALLGNFSSQHHRLRGRRIWFHPAYRQSRQPLQTRGGQGQKRLKIIIRSSSNFHSSMRSKGQNTSWDGREFHSVHTYYPELEDQGLQEVRLSVVFNW